MSEFGRVYFFLVCFRYSFVRFSLCYLSIFRVVGSVAILFSESVVEVVIMIAIFLGVVGFMEVFSVG